MERRAHGQGERMSGVFRLAIVDPQDNSREALKETLSDLDFVWLESECTRYELFAEIVTQTRPDVIIVALDADPDRALRLVEEMGDLVPTTSILVTSGTADSALILRALRVSAKEFLTCPIDVTELKNALNRIGHATNGASGEKSQRCVAVAVAGASGGVGATSLAVNLGCVLARDERNHVVLVDLDLVLGDMDIFLDSMPDYTLADVALNAARLDLPLLKQSLTRHGSGVYLLPRPLTIEDANILNEDGLRRVLSLLKASFTHVIIDISKGYTALDLAALESADEVFLVTQLDLPGLRNVVKLTRCLDQMDGLSDKLKIVANRVGRSDGQIGFKKAEETIGKQFFWKLPNDYRVMIEMRNNGVPLIERSPRAALTQEIVALAESMPGGSASARGVRTSLTSRWLSFWPSADRTDVGSTAEHF